MMGPSGKYHRVVNVAICKCPGVGCNPNLYNLLLVETFLKLSLLSGVLSVIIVSELWCMSFFVSMFACECQSPIGL